MRMKDLRSRAKADSASASLEQLEAAADAADPRAATPAAVAPNVKFTGLTPNSQVDQAV